MKIIFIFLFLASFCAYSQVGSAPAPSAKEIETFNTVIKDKEVVDKMIGSEQFSDCQKEIEGLSGDQKQDKLRECMSKKLANLDENALKQLDERMNLGIYDAQKSTSARSLKEYLSERLNEAIYGDKGSAELKLKSLKERNLVDHKVFYQMYEEQLGKNTMLHISQYCLETFGYEDGFNFVEILGQAKDGSGKPKFWDAEEKVPMYNYRVIPLLTEVREGGKLKEYKIQNDEYDNISAPAISGEEFWKTGQEVREFNVCSNKDYKECKDDQLADGDIKKVRTVDMIEKLKIAQFKLGETSAKSAVYSGNDSNIIKEFYSSCYSIYIPKMCELYRCKNTYDKNSPPKQKELCNDRYGHNPDINGVISDLADKKVESNSNPVGFIACTLLDELKKYRSMIAATQDQKKKLINDPTSTFGVDVEQSSFSDVYSGVSKGKLKGVDELTSISSKDLVNNVEELAKSEEKAQELKDACLKENPPNSGNFELKDGALDDEQCSELVATLDKSTFQEIEGEADAQTAVYMDKVNKMTSLDQIKTFIEENNLKEIMSREDFDTLKIEQLQSLVKESFRKEKMAELDAIKQRFQKQLAIEEDSTTTPAVDQDQVKSAIAQEKVADMEQHRKRLESLFQYSNIVSSYLTVKQGDEEVGANTTGRELETANMTDEEQAYLKYYGEGATGSKTKTAEVDYLGWLSSIIGD